jgi:hypothetical protein
LGFYYIPYTEKQKNKTESRDAVVTISEGSLTAAQVTVELERLLPGIKWNWVIEEIGDKSFATTFPSEAELQRMVLWGPVVARGANAKMEIKEKKDTEIWKYEIPKIWIQFRGIPKEFKDFPIIWAIGSIFGVTSMVDMKFTKRYGRPRMKVAVINPDLIPEFVDIVIGDFVYELQLRVEKEGGENNHLPINMDEQPKEDGDKDKEKNPEEAGKEFNAKNAGDAHPRDKELGKEGTANGKGSASSALMAAQATALSSIADPNNDRLTVVLNPTGAADNTGAWVAESFYGQTAHDGTSKKIPATTPTRKSKRNMMLADQDSIERASQLKAPKNLEVSNNQGTEHVNSFISFFR